MRWVVIIMLFGLYGCGSMGESAEVSKEQDSLQKYVQQKEFKVLVNRAYPQQSSAFNQAVEQLDLNTVGNNASMINVSGESYYVKFKNDSVFANLPFYGQRYSGAVVNPRQNSIRFEGLPRALKINNEKRNGFQTVRFKIKDKNRSTEHYTVGMKIYNNGKTNMVINSSSRSPIEFSGRAEPRDQQ